MIVAYAMYLRKSRKDLEAELRGEGETLARHRRILRELADSMRLPVNTIYQEVVTGDTIAGRPKMQQLLTDIEQGAYEGVFVMEVERLARGDTIDQGIVAQTFKYTDTKIITPMKTYDPANLFDEEFFEFALFMSRREYSTIKRRLTAGRVAAVKEGQYLGSVAPYGYDKIHTADGYTLAPNDESNIVRKIFAWYTTEDLGTTRIAHRLNELGCPAKKGGVWTTATVQCIIHNPVYIGKIHWNRRQSVRKFVDGQISTSRPRSTDFLLVPGLHEALVSEEIWNAAQEIIKNNRPSPVPRGKETKNPLSGIIICGKCGRKMKRRPYTHDQAPSLVCQIAECDNVSSYLDVVERKVISSLEELVAHLTGRQAAQDVDTSDDERTISQLTSTMNVLGGQQDQIRTLLEQGVYDIPTYQDRNAKIAAQILSTQSRLDTAVAELRNKETTLQRERDIIPAIRVLLGVYWQSSAAAKNQLLKSVIDHIVYTRDVSTKWKSPDQFDLDIKLKL